MEDAQPAHYEYGASSAKRWTSCLASVRLNKKCPPSADSEWGIEGRQAHKLLELCLMFGERNASAYTGVAELNGEKFEAAVTPEMARAVQVCLDYVYDICAEHADAIVSIENKLRVPSSVVPDRMGGTYDVRIYIPSMKWVIVIDYKHGAGIYVEEEDNLQMEMYDVASLWNMSEPVARVTNTIVQPRSWVAGGAVRSTDVTVEHLLWRHAWFEKRAELTLDPDAPFAPSPENCRWCPAGGYGLCPAVTAVAVKALNDEAKNFEDLNVVGLPDGTKLSIARMAFWLSNEALILALAKNIRMTATGFVRAGGDFPGFKMVLGTPERAWYGNPEVIAQQLCALLGASIDEVFPRSLITITEAQNRLTDIFRHGLVQEPGETKKAFKVRQNKASEMATEALAYMTLREPRGGPRLVPITDPRPALNTAVPHFAGQLNVEGL